MNRRRFFILTLVVFGVLLVTGYVILRHTGATLGLVRQILSESIREDLFRLGDANFDITDGTVTMRRFELEHPESKKGDSPLLAVDKIEVEVETNPLGEVGAVRNISLEGLVIHLSLAEGEMPEIGKILKEAGVGAPEESGTGTLPGITATGSTVHLRVARDRPTVTFTDVSLKLLPQEGSPKDMVLTGSMVSPLGHTIAIRGGGNLAERRFRTSIEMNDVPIKPEQAASFQAEAARFLGDAGVTGMVDQASLWIDVHDTPDRALRPQAILAGLHAKLSKLNAKPTLFPYQIRDAAGSIHAVLNDGGKVKFHLKSDSSQGTITTIGKLSRLISPPGERFAPAIDVQLKVDDLDVGGELRQALARAPIPLLNNLEAGFEPSAGRATGTARVFNDTPGGRLQVTADLSVEGGAMNFRGLTLPSGTTIGFPYPLHGVGGKIAFRDDRLILDHLSAQSKDGASARLDGEIYLGSPAQVNLDIVVDRVPFSDPLRTAFVGLLPDLGPQIWRDYEPRGTADIKVRLRDFGRGFGYDVEVRPIEASASYRLFPYRIGALQGLVRVANEGVWIDLDGKQDSADVSIHGRFMLGEASGDEVLQSELWIQGNRIPIDKDVIDASASLSKDLESILRDARLGGTVDCEITTWKERADKDMTFDVHARLRDGRADPKRFPLPIRDLAGDVFVYGTTEKLQCDVHTLRGTVAVPEGTPPPQLFIQGTVRHGPRATEGTITSMIQRLELGDVLRDALDQAEFISKAQWDSLRLEGVIDVATEHTLVPGNPIPVDRSRVQLHDVTCASDRLPGTLRRILGEFELHREGASFQRITGSWDEVPFSLRRGEAKFGLVPKVSFLVDADRVPLDPRFGALLRPQARAAFTESEPAGRFGLSAMQVTITLPPDGVPKTEVEGTLSAHDLFFKVGGADAAVRHLTGTSLVKGVVQGEGMRFECGLQNLRFELRKKRVSALNGRLILEPTALKLHDLNFNVAEGRVWGNGKDDLAILIRPGNPPRVTADLVFSNLSLNAILKERGLAHSKVRGLLSGEVHVEEFLIGQFLDLRAHGEIGVNNGRLGRVPLFSALYSHIAENKRPQFTQGSTRFRIENQKITLEDIKARSKEFRIEGGGILGMDGYLDIQLRLPGVFGRAADILIIPPLIDWTVSKVAAFQLYGYIRNPKLAWTFNKERGRQPIAPIGPAPVRQSAPSNGAPRGPTTPR